MAKGQQTGRAKDKGSLGSGSQIRDDDGTRDMRGGWAMVGRAGFLRSPHTNKLLVTCQQLNSHPGFA